MNNKGFTIIELIVTIIILSVILSIGAYSILGILKESRERNYQTLIKHIKSAVETYDIECRYSRNSDSNIICEDEITLGNLVKYGYLTGNAKFEDGSDKDKYTIVNPMDNESIANCIISYTNTNGKIAIYAQNPTGSCPTSY